MEKSIYNVVLRDGCDQDHFLTEGDGKDLEVHSALSQIPGLITLKLTHAEALKLLDSDDIITIEVDLRKEPLLYPVTTPLKSLTVDLVAGFTYPFPYTEFVGKFASHFFHYTSDIPITGNTTPLGYSGSEDNRSTNEVVTQNYAGHYVDIVAVEAGSGDASLDGYEDHPDFDNEDGTASRFVKMDWNQYDASIADTKNRQVTNNTTYFDFHAIGVLSVAGGKYCGWAKVSSLRVIYLNVDSDAAVFNAVLQWHNTKPVNPVTGKRNATMITNAWGYTQGISHAIPVDAITSINARDTANNEVVINRPGGGSWNNDFRPFYDNCMIPRILRDPITNQYGWYITRDPYQAASSTLNSILTALKNAGGIYFNKSAGNNTSVGVKSNDPRWNTRCNTTGSITYLTVGNTSGQVTVTQTTGTGMPNFYPLRVLAEAHPDMLVVGAMQHSTANPLPDAYSSRGPMIDVFGFGNQTWSASPAQVYSGGPVAPPGWPGGWFGGTSCAGPVVAGISAVMIDHFFVQRGVYPTMDQLKSLVVNNAVSRVQEEHLASIPSYTGQPWQESETPSGVIAITSSRLRFSKTNLYGIIATQYWNGGMSLPELGSGTTTKHAFLPYKIRLGNGKYISDVRGVAYGSRPSNGQAYPRRKIKIGSN